IRQAIGHGKRRLIVGADHAHHALVPEHDEVNILMVEFVDESAGAGGLVLRDFVDEGTVIETMHLLEFLFRFGSFKMVRTDAQHSWTTSDGAFGGRPKQGRARTLAFAANM